MHCASSGARSLRAPNRYAYADTLAAAGIKASVFGFLPFTILELSQKLRVDFRKQLFHQARPRTCDGETWIVPKALHRADVEFVGVAPNANGDISGTWGAVTNGANSGEGDFNGLQLVET